MRTHDKPEAGRQAREEESRMNLWPADPKTGETRWPGYILWFIGVALGATFLYFLLRALSR